MLFSILNDSVGEGVVVKFAATTTELACTHGTHAVQRGTHST